MTIRPAELEDLPVCLALNHSYMTHKVWQMDLQEENGVVAVTFRTMRLPRPVHVGYPRDKGELLSAWHRRDCFLVATDMNEGAEEIVGYLTMTAQEWHRTGWMADLVVAPAHRRQGVATRLLRAGQTWARRAGLRRLTVEIQTKNHPGICFLERHGFCFCGYNDRYYTNEDIALFFTLDLR